MARQRELTRELAVARDAQVAKVVALVDAMRERGAADELIAPLRARLHHLHVDRPLRLGRLLFLPLDPVIVDTRGWRPGQPAVPRGVLGPLLVLVRDRLGVAVNAIEGLIAGHGTTDAGVVSRAGRMLWPLAARVLQAAAGGMAPGGWGEDGVPVDCFGAVARGVGGVLGQAVQAGFDSGSLCAAGR